MRDHVLFEPQTIPYLSQYTRYLVLRVRWWREVACWLYDSLCLPFLVQKLHSTVTEAPGFMKRKCVIWTEEYLPNNWIISLSFSMDPMWGWISFNSILGQEMRKRYFSLSGHPASCCEGFSTANKVHVRCDCQIKCRNKCYILDKLSHSQQAAK